MVRSFQGLPVLAWKKMFTMPNAQLIALAVAGYFTLAPAAAQDTTDQRMPTNAPAQDSVSPEIRAKREAMFAFFSRNMKPLASDPPGMPARYIHHDP